MELRLNKLYMFWSPCQKLYCTHILKANCDICIQQIKKQTKYYRIIFLLTIAVFNEFGDRVKLWITLNEPWVVSIQGHGKGDMAPGMKGPGILEYKVAHNLIRSHAKAYRVYQNEFVETQQGMVCQISCINGLNKYLILD